MAAETKELLVKISATTELLRQQMIAAENSVERSTRAMQRDLDKFDGSMGKLNKTSSLMASGLKFAATSAAGFIASIGVGTVVDFTRRAISFADAIGDAADQLGVSTKFLQEFRFAVEQSGGTVEGADTALGKFAVSLGKALSGNKAATKSFESLGISMKDLKAADEVGRFSLVADAIARIPDPAQQSAAAFAIFGRNAREIIPLLTQGSAGFKQLAAEGARLGVVLSAEQIANADKLARKFDALTAALNVKVAGVVLENAKEIGQLTDDIAKLADQCIKAIPQIKAFLKSLEVSPSAQRSSVLPHCTAHGLRKAMARRLADGGASQQSIKAVGGWKGDTEVAIYTAAADQKRLASAAIQNISGPDLANRDGELANSFPKVSENEG